ncbi:3-hydroxyacyl-CoA dehydrogenase family protein [Actinoalloteichus spitiensis]|uniref:3-hydroxyacyl-CoA dehydrogenase family protein n=1 Tax=Actinoalloteichus spitiensis TaxID=252394 RepID=UPI00037F6C76|nr:3-hydroxyacyl-CoA dehydrogenase family protein [Actinoalloteichus spitiensis]
MSERNDDAERPPGVVGVVGAGTMGVGITQCLAEAGYPVVVVDDDPGALAAGPRRLRDALRMRLLAGSGAGRSRPADATGEVVWTDRLADLSGAGFVIECAFERVPVKRAVLAGLDEVCPPPTVFASCTSAIPVTRLASFTGRADRVIGMHFMNPAPLKPTVEVVRAPTTSQPTVDRALALLASLGKSGVVVGDAPGFVSNRVLMLTVNEAARVVEEGTADADAVDQIFRECFGHPMGPLRTADLIGLDTIRDSLLVLLEHTGDDRFTPCRLLDDLVGQGALGRKAGRGFHDHPAPR